MTRHKFNKHSDGARFRLLDAAKAFYADFPAETDDVHVIDVATGRLVLSRGDAADIKLRADGHRDLQQAIRDYAAAKSSGQYGCGIGRFILSYPAADTASQMLGAHAPAAQNQFFIFDHECGHIVNPGHGRSERYREAVADVFAAIRHWQRFGIDTDAIEKLIARRAKDRGEYADCARALRHALSIRHALPKDAAAAAKAAKNLTQQALAKPATGKKRGYRA